MARSKVVSSQCNENGDPTHLLFSDGYECWWEHDDQGRVVYYHDSKGFESWYTYDNDGNMIRQHDSKGNEWVASDDDDDVDFDNF